jgi:hypothetical protein
MPRVFHVLNLGAGVQSTTLYLMSAAGEILRFDYAIFADTQEEPEAVYRHLEWLQTVGGPPILVRTKAKLGDDLMYGKNSTGQSFASIPAFTIAGEGDPGRMRRQCSKEYKTDIIERCIRRDILGLKQKQWIPKDVRVHQYFGISLDEKSRASRIWERFHVTCEAWAEPHFPLIDRAMTRANCILWLEDRVPHPVPRSACTFCPFHSDAEWQHLKDAQGADWERLVQIDRALRTPGVIVNRNLDQKIYLHRSCLPIDEIDFKPKTNRKELQLGFGFDNECEGVCGV